MSARRTSFHSAGGAVDGADGALAISRQVRQGKTNLADPVTLEVVRHGLVAAAEQMATSIERSARSQVIREMLDYSTGVFDREGGIVAQSTRIPMHLNSMTRPLQTILRDHYPLSEWRAGDVFVTNDPYSGGQHLPDIMTFSPITMDGREIAISGELGGHPALGGRGPSSYGADATEIYQEGLQLPPMRIVREGDWNEIFLPVFAKNIRVPDKTIGDLKAQIAALTIGADEVRRIALRYGIETFLACTEELLAATRRNMEAAIEALPDGVFRAEDVIDGDGLDDDPIPIRVAVHRTGKQLIVDFTGSADQVRGPVNCPLAATESAVYYATAAVLQSGTAPNRGAYDAIRVIAPEGCVLNPRHPAPVVGRNVFTHRVANITMAALGEALPDRACAHHYGNSNVHILHAQEPNGAANVLFEIGVGGWGGRPGKDGPDGLSQGIHNLANNPIEMVEHEFPGLILEYSFITDSGGPGRWRGGMGIERSMRVDVDCEFSAQYDRIKFPAPGLHGGGPGRPARLLLERRGDETVELAGKVVGYRLRKGDVIRIQTQGGGGLGDPVERDPARLRRDVAEGKVTFEAAVRDYGMSPDAEGEPAQVLA
jgi:N-methylhydantoinase B